MNPSCLGRRPAGGGVCGRGFVEPCKDDPGLRKLDDAGADGGDEFAVQPAVGCVQQAVLADGRVVGLCHGVPFAWGESCVQDSRT